MRIGTVIIVIWLAIGALAAFQRGYFTGAEDAQCSSVADTALTVVAGPLNYVGVNPKVQCKDLPKPSK